MGVEALGGTPAQLPGVLAKIPGNFDIDWTWPPGARLLKSFGEGGGKRSYGCHAKRPLSDRCRSLCREIRALRSMHVLPQPVRWDAAEIITSGIDWK